MSIKNYTKDYYKKLEAQLVDINSQIEYVKKKTAEEMWLIELDEFVAAYEKWKHSIEIVESKLTKNKIKRRKK